MLVSLRMPQRRRRSPGPARALGRALGRVLVRVLVLMLALGSAGCSSDPPSEPRSTAPTPATTPVATPLGDYDTSRITLLRASFCGRVADELIIAALAAGPSDKRTWRPGGRVPGSKDISNEFGCSWTAGSVSARAWVFAPPITSAQATHFAEDVADKKCRRVSEAPALGEPGAAQRCGATASLYGLVGDAWVACEISGLTGPATAQIQRVGEWCVAVLEAMRSD